MRRTILILVAAVAFGPCALGKNLDRINWADRAAWNCVKIVAIRPFPVAGEFKGVKSQEEYMKYFVAHLSDALVRPGGIEKVFLATRGEVASADAFVTGEFLELSAGSRAARFWVGYGAGTAKTEIRIRGYRSDERTPIFDLEHARIAPFSLSGDANLGDIEAVASDVGEELLRRRSECNLAEVKPASPIQEAAGAPEPRGAEVSIESSVENAEVYVDGNFVGNAPLPKFRMSAGNHLLEVKAAGYQNWKRVLAVSANASTRVVAQLERPRQ
jgi:PEGA domain.